jgi:hypothetical protein
MNTKDVRRLETRTKIQLGGLMIKAGLTEQLGIALGTDLQQDVHALNKATILLGALVHLSNKLDTTPQLKEEWERLGLVYMKSE